MAGNKFHRTKRQEAEVNKSKKRWNILDAIVLKALAVFLGRTFVSFIGDMKPDYVENTTFYPIFLVICLVVCPIILLYCTDKWSLPPSVKISSSDGRQFQFKREGKRLYLYEDGELIIDEVHDLDSDKKGGKILLAGHPAKKEQKGDKAVKAEAVAAKVEEQELQKETATGEQYLKLTDLEDMQMGDITVCIDHMNENWPKAELGYVSKMLEDTDHWALYSAWLNFWLLTSKVVTQILSWTIKDWVAKGTSHTWGDAVGWDILLALVYLVAFWVLTWISKYFKFRSFIHFYHAPFQGPQNECCTAENWRELVLLSFELIRGCLPLSVGFVMEQVLLTLKEAASGEYTFSRQDVTYRPVVMFCTSVAYFVIVGTICLLLTAFFPLLVRLLCRQCLSKYLPECVSQPSWANPGQTPVPAEPEQDAANGDMQEAAAAPAPELSVEEVPQEPAVRREGSNKVVNLQRELRDMFDRQLMEQTQLLQRHLLTTTQERETEDVAPGKHVADLTNRVVRLERALGFRGSEERPEEDLKATNHWDLVLESTFKEVTAKTIKFTFGWASLYLAEAWYYYYVLECSKNSKDYFATDGEYPDCTYKDSLVFAILVFCTTFGYLFVISGLDEHARISGSWFTLQMQAFPLVVGWAANSHVVDVLKELKNEFTEAAPWRASLAAFIVSYIIALPAYNTWSRISADARLKLNDLI
mmetsp:Transcript_144263/g.402069  ORF Transcript_144263/g.402069 Transcript_144263/m.402069 type:complete len:700 (-) Transcript_144263:101-2200(-)|eukprot:CAMPEP_0179025572 /NCGR_PEP_ID=MMETSP0796-20121207/8057_1 /TAXON_ID=73915 /ORGANISM="Pyrodinium bahamense, Strain pbaha01" /LENGTH=699 /DNA_ID=CAMNT_0020721603 /DNA_START=73 /DNA_END=2172 /DNA_ORIENTATION=+